MSILPGTQTNKSSKNELLTKTKLSYEREVVFERISCGEEIEIKVQDPRLFVGEELA